MKKLLLITICLVSSFGVFSQTITNKIESTGNVGIGTTTPVAPLHVKSSQTTEDSNNRLDANLIIEGSGTTRETGKGASLGFVVPANTDGTNPWQQGRILVTPDNTINQNACGQMFIQTRFLNNSTWDWKDNLVLKSNGNVGIGQTSPNAALDIKRDGIALEIDHSTSGGNSMIKFNSVVNNGSDKAFILFQDESTNCQGSSNEDVRLTMGVFNDFRASSLHSDELWLQGGGRLVQNVGKWDSELNTIIGTPSVGTTGGYEWRINNSTKMNLSHDGVLTIFGVFIADEIKVKDIAATNLQLDGYIAANQITVKANGNTADFVFSDSYNLKDLTEVENYIKTHKHLPDIPSAEEMEASGVNLAEMNKLLLQKVEELMLYQIEKDKEVKELKDGVKKAMEARNKEQGEREKLEEEVSSMKNELKVIKQLLINNQNNAK